MAGALTGQCECTWLPCCCCSEDDDEDGGGGRESGSGRGNACPPCCFPGGIAPTGCADADVNVDDNDVAGGAEVVALTEHSAAGGAVLICCCCPGAGGRGRACDSG